MFYCVTYEINIAVVKAILAELLVLLITVFQIQIERYLLGCLLRT